MKLKIIKFKSVQSTNNTAIKLIQKYKNISGLVVSEIQTRGKGTMGKRWISKKKNIFISIFFKVDLTKYSIKNFLIINAKIIKKVLKNYTNKIIKIKKPNDLLIENKKTEAKQIERMKFIGSFPILKFKDSSSSESYEINKPCISFGRDKKSNDIHISNINMSRSHFSIIFKDSNYLILDNDSTNGMIINGYKLKTSILKNGDVIEIADATFTFYI